MKKKELELIEDKIKEKDYLGAKDYTLKLQKAIFVKNLIFIGIIALLLIFGLINYNLASKLSIINPKIYITIIIISLICFSISLVLFKAMSIYYIYKDKDDYSKRLITSYKSYNMLDSIGFFVSTIAILVFVVLFVITPAEVSGTSMEKTYSSGDKVLVWHLGYKPSYDDVVVVDVKDKYQYEGSSTEFIIKRVIAKEGDTLTYDTNTGELFVNGVYVEKITLKQYKTILTYKSHTINDTSDDVLYYGNINPSDIVSDVVPKGFLIAFGDNRALLSLETPVSNDSRNIGLINNSDVLGKAILRIYPFDKMGNPKQNSNR